MPVLNVGGHLSLDGNPRRTVAWAADNGFHSMQIFASSPGAWKPPILGNRDLDDFIRARREYGVNPLFIHAIYLINLASADAALARRSRASLLATLRAGEAMGAVGVITHIGSHGGRGFDAVAGDVAAALREIRAEAPPDIDLVLENSAGAGALIGAELSELGELLERAGRHPHLKVALDTAHLCGAGWDFQETGSAARLVSEIDRLIGLDRLTVIHTNDSAAPPGSRRDRHTNIGEGHIGREGFRALLAEEALRRVPWILETPDLEHRIDDRTTLEALAVQPLGVETQS
jgi:deoxyribonuclease-4